MIKNQKSLNTLKLIIDLLFLNFSFVISAFLAQPTVVLFERKYIFILLLLLNFGWYIGARATEFYEDAFSRLSSFEIILLLKNLFLQLTLSIFFLFAIKEGLFTRNFIILNTAILFGFVLLRIFLFNAVLFNLRKDNSGKQKYLLIGNNEISEEIRELFENNPQYGFSFAGSISMGEGNADQEINSLELFLSQRKVDDVLIILENYEDNLLREILRVCDKYAVKTHIVPGFVRFLSRKFHLSMIADFPVVTIRKDPLSEFQWKVLKRLFDIFVSLVAIILIISWLFPILILTQILLSKGPVFFTQERIGKNGRIFRCYKFRTMSVQKVKPEEFNPTMKDDPRVTKFGKILRKSNLDELPQIFNVLLGDMSLVGPRPHAVNFEKTYNKYVEEIKLRNIVKPGITGWAQVHGLRGDVKDEENNRRRTKRRIEYDIWYTENWSIWLDIQIIMMTIWQMITGNTKGY